MITPEELKTMVRDKYSKIAEQTKEQNETSCCGAARECNEVDYTIFSQNYTSLDGYVADADLGLGCGLPTAHAEIKPGMTVLDLGSGAGNDVFIAAKSVGSEGKAIGIDMTQTMIDKANANKAKTGLTNVDFRLGEIENMPVDDASVDVVLSNCVLNLVPDKQAAFNEIGRVTKPGGWFSISDIVLEGQLPPALREVAELYAGCVSGAIQKQEYLNHIAEAGFTNIEILEEKEVAIPDQIIKEATEGLPDEQRSMNGARVLSITVKGVKS